MYRFFHLLPLLPVLLVLLPPPLQLHLPSDATSFLLYHEAALVCSGLFLIPSPSCSLQNRYAVNVSRTLLHTDTCDMHAQSHHRSVNSTPACVHVIMVVGIQCQAFRNLHLSAWTERAKTEKKRTMAERGEEERIISAILPSSHLSTMLNPLGDHNGCFESTIQADILTFGWFQMDVLYALPILFLKFLMPNWTVVCEKGVSPLFKSHRWANLLRLFSQQWLHFGTQYWAWCRQYWIQYWTLKEFNFWKHWTYPLLAGP